MKKHLLLLALAVSIIACEKDNPLDTNLNPDQQQEVSLEGDVVFLNTPENEKNEPSAERNPYGDFVSNSMRLSGRVRVYRHQPQIDPAFQVYWDEFVQAAKATPGVCGVCIEQIEFIKIQFKEISSIGRSYNNAIYTLDKKIIDIDINPNFWEGSSPGGKKLLLWHELGHAVFRAAHASEGLMIAGFGVQSESKHFRDAEEWMGLYAQGEHRNQNKVVVFIEDDLRYFQE